MNAAKRLCSCVSHNMFCQVTWCRESLVTLGAVKKLLSCVWQNMWTTFFVVVVNEIFSQILAFYLGKSSGKCWAIVFLEYFGEIIHTIMENMFGRYCSLTYFLASILLSGGRICGSQVLSIWDPGLYWWEQVLGKWQFSPSGKKKTAKRIHLLRPGRQTATASYWRPPKCARLELPGTGPTHCIEISVCILK